MQKSNLVNSEQKAHHWLKKKKEKLEAHNE